MAGIPRELDEAAIIDGASPLRLFLSVIFPLLRPAVITVIVVATVAVYNDFVNPLYFLPGTESVVSSRCSTSRASSTRAGTCCSRTCS